LYVKKKKSLDYSGVSIRMTPFFQYFKKYNPLSKEAEQAISEISSIVTVKKNLQLFQGHNQKWL